MVFATVMDDQPLSHHAVKSWHQLLTRHQSGAAGRDLDGRRVEIPLRKAETGGLRKSGIRAFVRPGSPSLAETTPKFG